MTAAKSFMYVAIGVVVLFKGLLLPVRDIGVDLVAADKARIADYKARIRAKDLDDSDDSQSVAAIPGAMPGAVVVNNPYCPAQPAQPALVALPTK
jgi:hypothetical protein